MRPGGSIFGYSLIRHNAGNAKPGARFEAAPYLFSTRLNLTASGIAYTYKSPGEILKTSEVLQAWATILSGRTPSISIELTRECPLRCPGCYAYEEDHLGIPGVTLRQLADYKDSALVQGTLRLIDEHRPLHVSLVGGDPLVRFRELEELLPELERRGIHVQLVTSAFRQIPVRWNALSRLNIVVSVDGLQPEHDIRRKPATYERILKSIAGTKVTIHCTVTGQMMKRTGYLEDFVRFWSGREETKKIWISLFTPQAGATGPEILTPRRAETGNGGIASIADCVSLDRYEEGVDRRTPASAGFAQRLHLRPHHAHCFGRPEDADYAVPVWWHPGLLTVWLYRKHGSRRRGASSGGARRHRRTALLSVRPDRKGSKQASLLTAAQENLLSTRKSPKMARRRDQEYRFLIPRD